MIFVEFVVDFAHTIYLLFLVVDNRSYMNFKTFIVLLCLLTGVIQ